MDESNYRPIELSSFRTWHATESILLGIITFLLAYYWYKKPRGFPPGPRGVPILGVVPFMGKFAPKTFRDWGKIYGPIIGIRVGRNNAVVLNDIEAIQEVRFNISRCAMIYITLSVLLYLTLEMGEGVYQVFLLLCFHLIRTPVLQIMGKKKFPESIFFPHFCLLIMGPK